MPPAAKPTLYAQRGLEFVAVFQVRFATMNVSGHAPRLRPPPGESTAGGKLATQHIVLEPPNPSDTVWTVGSVNVVTKAAKLRTYDCVRALHWARFKDRPFPLDRAQYQAFFDAVITFAREREIEVEVENAPPEIDLAPEGGRSSLEPGGGSSSVSLVSVIVIALLLALGAAGAVFLALRNFSQP